MKLTPDNTWLDVGDRVRYEERVPNTGLRRTLHGYVLAVLDRSPLAYHVIADDGTRHEGVPYYDLTLVARRACSCVRTPELDPDPDPDAGPTSPDRDERW